ncbi:uncharacterized protein MYCFIDRAFT_169233 [Pseudocercospora fijiensis CIRAD86]|uniref:Uncharacterized protein n=1 Tax=Pseudocercospora fijiensis (strain CIRAD86) TaxID=383855 RepID=N1Q5V6_PSEFD|nr:uncharacterized protein MYCFIDRAFT_169233 [Pseudocercospora fijiensis CIRAD86]EME87399.1 hypothetical protein MYCFIDRAFT_169233 [Pseudocercospora fijiensis CIRAD86]
MSSPQLYRAPGAFYCMHTIMTIPSRRHAPNAWMGQPRSALLHLHLQLLLDVHA